LRSEETKKLSELPEQGPQQRWYPLQPKWYLQQREQRRQELIQ
jgi:hypothetical protein